MIEQIIRYSDGTETSIKYRGRVVNGEVILDKKEEVEEAKEEESITK